MKELDRVLELVMRELQADDARVEIGGRPPEDPRHVWHELRPGVRLVAILPEPPEDLELARARIAHVVEGFASTTDEAVAEALGPMAGARRSTGRRELADALAIVRARTEAAAVVIIDDNSPEIWGSDPVLPWPDVEAAIEAAAEGPAGDPTTLAARAIARVRHDPTPTQHAAGPNRPAVHAPRLLGIYRLVLAFATPPSPLRVTGALRRAHPVLERLLRDLPPREPPPTEARVLPMVPRGD